MTISNTSQVGQILIAIYSYYLKMDADIQINIKGRTKGISILTLIFMGKNEEKDNILITKN